MGVAQNKLTHSVAELIESARREDLCPRFAARAMGPQRGGEVVELRFLLSHYARQGAIHWEPVEAIHGPDKGEWIDVRRVVRGIISRASYRIREVCSLLTKGAQTGIMPDATDELVEEVTALAAIIHELRHDAKKSVPKEAKLRIRIANGAVHGALRDAIEALH